MQTALKGLFILPLVIACISWTVTHEEVFKEPREFCERRCKAGRHLLERKFFYLFTCEYCFSHYVTIFILCLTQYKLLLDDWRGYIIAGFSLVWIANVYMTLFALFRQNVKIIKIRSRFEEEILESENGDKQPVRGKSPQ
ncbi:MAG: hypothetical protein ABIS01_15770 [Ferruginibacter sp.]